MKEYINPVGLALAGHASRVSERNADKYDNSLTDLVNLIIAEVKAKGEENVHG